MKSCKHPTGLTVEITHRGCDKNHAGWKGQKKSRSLHEISVKKPGIFVSYHAEGFA